ncbi:Fibrinogen, alpha/beta/gamma chain, C-terminal globular domain and Fibrinogen, alpha/beta/gamma chain,C-terminal globular, subdomain 2 and Fibrinogen,alpha/beta/gamma chain, C-terminal globular, subdomain 1-containing protein [Strongyloides ratti]|uniref:Fibrinogen C-terminal domain-containing protein n=1 Tax=Strongyloides ratti TaxID=34506 RepID=A0A090KUJ3_STRRB|nr:Fibrinogen, alpha/beta/gamma chain, C-terminal globular domain and Fibrinogen, alpha/beta/gamma chain,C-terminal globular, subdomain 2 and Fibrinogen,alpha/beta/gamma chain, C-terminal globular, subdomain 1-containing protein [Strongyloides ratti]CEF61170.1 Fibrinogen, alpha/beta/gamma chain, C-terminal globular domain and Fibrinogen, alpha/beta/gamma chain,C-terminal globular, subdomain 2 and Fibrinogen,alpha/beta/gamma chain, C-terminal globular, subdomain 1-containing protein [Strongyloides 
MYYCLNDCKNLSVKLILLLYLSTKEMMSDGDVEDVIMDSFLPPNNSLLGGSKEYFDETLYGLEEQYKPASRKKFYFGIIIGVILFLLIVSGLFYLVVYMPNDKYDLVRREAIFDRISPINMYQEHKNYQDYLFRPEEVSMEILNSHTTLDYIPIAVTERVTEKMSTISLKPETTKPQVSTTSSKTTLVVKEIKEAYIFNVSIKTDDSIKNKVSIEHIKSVPKEQFKSNIKSSEPGKRMYNFSTYVQDPYGSTINNHEKLSNVAYDVPKNSCNEVKMAGPSSNGVYNLFINKVKVHAVCDMKAHSGPYMVVQRRISSDIIFWNRTFKEYQFGFGDPSTNYWLGLEHLYQYQEYLKKNSKSKDFVLLLRIELRTNVCDSNGSHCSTGNVLLPTYFWHEYKMKLSGPDDYYRLNIESIRGNLSTQNDFFVNVNSGRRFTTVDVDNDDSARVNCAERYSAGGWWYNKCSHANLNGIYPDPKDVKTKFGMKWRYSSPIKLNSASNAELKRDVHPDATLMLVKPL